MSPRHRSHVCRRYTVRPLGWLPVTLGLAMGSGASCNDAVVIGRNQSASGGLAPEAGASGTDEAGNGGDFGEGEGGRGAESGTLAGRDSGGRGGSGPASSPGSGGTTAGTSDGGDGGSSDAGTGGNIPATGGTGTGGASGAPGGSAGTAGTGGSAGTAGTGGSTGTGGTECGVGSVYAGDYRTGVDHPSVVAGASSITGSVEVVAEDISTLRCITSIDGDLTVTALPNLGGLERLVRVGGDLIVRGTPTDLEGLRNLATVGGGVDIVDESGLLIDLTGLRGLESVGGTLVVSASSMASLGLDSLATVGGNFIIASYALTTVAGPPQLTAIEGDLWLGESPDLFEWNLDVVEGFESLRSIGGSFDVRCNGALSVTLPSLEFVGGYFSLNNSGMIPEGPSPLALPSLTEIGGTLDIRGLSHENLTGLSNLRRVGALGLSVNSSLRSIAGLENLEIVTTGDVSITFTPLTDLEPLSSLTSIGLGLWIEEVPLADLNGLRNVTTIGDRLDIQGTNLRDFSGLSSLTAICTAGIGAGTCGLEIWNNPLLESLDGLPPMPSIEVVRLFNNDALTDLSAFEGTREISDTFFVAFNAELASLAGFSALESVGGGATFLNNPKLKTCEADALRLQLDFIGETFFAYGNDDVGTCDGG
jgi:hypothetical protein